MFEALASGIPLVAAPWRDTEQLFRAGVDYLVAHDRAEMTAHLKMLLDEPQTAAQIAASGLQRIRQRHTCAHRVDELLAIQNELAARRTELV
jgi:spore maturation protein CgeB